MYATNIDDTYIDSPTPCIDHVLDLPPDEFYQVHALSSRHPPSQRPVNPPDLPLGHNHNILGLPNPLEGLMDLFSSLLKSTSY